MLAMTAAAHVRHRRMPSSLRAVAVAIAVLSLLAAPLHSSLFVSAQLYKPACPPPTKAEDCTSVAGWSEFVNAVEASFVSSGGNGRAVLCPFDIAKSHDQTLVLEDVGPITIACNVPRECKITGGGGHIKIEGGSTEATLYGLTFVGGPFPNDFQIDPAVKVEDSATSRTMICNSNFTANKAYSGRGGGLGTEELTDVIVEGTSFENNYAMIGGGGIYNAGSMIVANSLFKENESQNHGGAIHNDGDAYLEVYSSNFVDNFAKRGHAIAVQSGCRTDDGRKCGWFDGGGSSGERNFNCDGFDDTEFYGENSCHRFTSKGDGQEHITIDGGAKREREREGVIFDGLDPTWFLAEDPTQSPTEDPTQSPTEDPTQSPTEEPIRSSTEEPTSRPNDETSSSLVCVTINTECKVLAPESTSPPACALGPKGKKVKPKQLVVRYTGAKCPDSHATQESDEWMCQDLSDTALTGKVKVVVYDKKGKKVFPEQNVELGGTFVVSAGRKKKKGGFGDKLMLILSDPDSGKLLQSVVVDTSCKTSLNPGENIGAFSLVQANSEVIKFPLGSPPIDCDSIPPDITGVVKAQLTFWIKNPNTVKVNLRDVTWKIVQSLADIDETHVVDLDAMTLGPGESQSIVGVAELSADGEGNVRITSQATIDPPALDCPAMDELNFSFTS